MASIRKKCGKYYLVESQRDGERVRQKVLAYLGRYPSIDEAVAGFQSDLNSEKKNKEDLQKVFYRVLGETGKYKDRKLRVSIGASLLRGEFVPAKERWKDCKTLSRRTEIALRISIRKITSMEKTLTTLQAIRSKQ
jgi:hypothetical protein